VRLQVPAEVKEGEALTAPGKKLQEIARELPDEVVQVSTRGDQIELRCGRSHFKLNGLPAEDFPQLPGGLRPGWTASWEGSALADPAHLVRGVHRGVAPRAERRALGTPRRRDADGGDERSPAGPDEDSGGTVARDDDAPDRAPAALQQVQRLFSDDDEVTVAREQNHLGFKAGNAEVYTRLIEGTYPNYEQVIPKDNDKSAMVQRKALESAVRRVAAVASDQTHRIRLEFEPGRMNFNVLTPDLGEAHDEIEVGYDGEPITIGFNANYLLEVLRYVGTDEVKMSFKAPERAAVRRAGGGRRGRGDGLPLPGHAASAGGLRRSEASRSSVAV
jgi:DNA polymerase III subunit beta